MRRRMLLATLLVGSVAACRTPSPAPPPIQAILVKSFQCADPIVAEAVRNVFLGALARESGARILRQGDADVVIEGTVTIGHGAGAESGWKGSHASAGEFVSGVTALVLRQGEIVTSAEEGQQLRGVGLKPPEEIAMRVADKLVRALRREGLGRSQRVEAADLHWWEKL
jgi:hypothetical protein